MQTFHFQLSGRIGDGSFTMSQMHADDAEAIVTAERLMNQSAIAQAATRLTVWCGDFGPTARCVAVYEIRPAVTFDRNLKIEASILRERTPYMSAKS